MKTDHTFADSNTTSILDNLNTAVFRTNLEGKASIIDVNPAFVKMFGYKNRKEIRSISLLELYADPADREGMKTALIRTGSIRDREIMLKRKDGSVFPGRVSSVLVMDEQGKGLFIDGVVDDISELKSKEKELQAERKVFFSGPVVMIQWPVSEDAPLINISENVVDLLGYEASDFLQGKVLYPDLVHEEDKPALQAHIRSVLKEGADVMFVHPYRLQTRSKEYIWIQDYAYIQRNDDGDAVGILGYIYDVTAQQRSQRESIEKEQLLRDLVENSPTGITRVDKEGNILEVNQRMVDMLGSPSREATMAFNVLTYEPLVKVGISQKFQEAMDEAKIVSFSGHYVSAWEKEIYFKLIISPSVDAEGKVVGAQSNLEDITETHLANEAERRIKRAQLEERRVFMAGPIMIIKWAFSADDPVLYVSENVEDILGYSVEEFTSAGMVPSMLIHPDDIEVVREASRNAIQRGDTAFEVAPYRLRKKDGSYIWVSDYSTVNRDEEGKPTDFSGIIWDVSKTIETEEELKLLLREVHHRVKNNMQVIISLLNLQAEYLQDAKLFEIFGETQNRIRSMALIHDKLYRSKKMSAVDFGSYIKTLILEINNFYSLDTNRIRVHQDVANVSLDISKAIPCGLIVNELVTNAMKHAFPDNREGDIWISGNAIDEETARIEIRDNGIGLDNEIVFEETQTMGLRIVRILTEQLEGNMRIVRKGGTRFKLTFDLVDPV